MGNPLVALLLLVGSLLFLSGGALARRAKVRRLPPPAPSAGFVAQERDLARVVRELAVRAQSSGVRNQ